MIPGQRPRKRRRTGLPIAVWLLLLALGGVLGWTGLHRLFPGPATEVAPPAGQEPPPPAAGDKPPAGKFRQPIFDRNMTALAVSFKQASVYLSPMELQEAQRPVEHLAAILGLTPEKLRAELRTERKFVWLKRNLDLATARKIADAKLSGVYLVDEQHRFYPFHDHAAHVVGFEKEDQGLAGAEFLYNSILRGDRTLATQYLNLPGLSTADIPVTGAAAVVSIDIDLQTLLERKLQALLQQTRAQSASAVVMDADSGEILAMSDLPSYDPNTYWKASASAYQNRLVNDPVPLLGLNAFFKAAAELAAGNLPSDLSATAGDDPDPGQVIAPRAFKIVKGETTATAAATPESQVWRPGIHLSPPFQWSQPYTVPEQGREGFCRQLGLAAAGSGLGETRLGSEGGKPAAGEPCRLDDDHWRVMPLNVLAAFSSLTNGGAGVSPHLLKGLWRMEDGSFHPLAFPRSEGVGQEASARFLSFVEGLEPPGPDDALVVESIRASKPPPLPGAVPAKVSEGGETGESIEELFRFAITTLGEGRENGHQLAVILLLDGASLDLSLPSPTRKTVAELIGQGQGLLAKRWDAKLKPPHLEPDQVLYQRWLESQAQEPISQPASNVGALEMPNVVGLSLRKAMQALQGFNLKVGIQGSGRVTDQSPAAGAKLKDVDEIKLKLAPDKP